MHRLFLVIATFFLFSSLNGQHINCQKAIEGYILDIDTKEALPFATVKVAGTNIGVTADQQGHFKLDHICEEEVDLEIRFIGYKPIVHHHDFHHSSPTIYLAAEETLLEGIVIEGESDDVEIKTLSSTNINVESIDGLGTTAGALFEKAGGVTTLRTGQNIVKPIIHGLHSNRIVIVNNGVRHAYQAWGEDHAPELDPSQIERIKVVKGASTVRYGSQALGGVILLDAPEPEFNKKLNGSVGTGFQTNGRALSGELSVNKGYKNIAWNMGISGTKQGDLQAPDYNLSNTGKRELGINLGGKFHFHTFDIDIYGSHFDQKLGILRGSVVGNLIDLETALKSEPPQDTRSFTYDIGTPRQESTHDLLKVKSSIYIGEHQFDAQYAFQRNSRKEFDIRRGTNNQRPSINLILTTHSFDFDWKRPKKGIWKGSTGVQLQTESNSNIEGTNTIPFVPNYDNFNIGLYSIESITSGKSTYEAGLRFDIQKSNVRGRDGRNNIYRNNLNYNNLTFTLGYSTELNDHLSFSTNIGTAWRAPNVGELYSFGKHQFVIEYGLWRHQLFNNRDSISTSGVLNNTLKNVENELGLKWIASLSYEKSKWKLVFTPFINHIQNYFYTRPHGLTTTARGAFPYFIYDQTNALYYGYDFNLRRHHKENWFSELKLSYVYARDLKNNQFFLEIPPLRIEYQLEKTIKDFRFTLNGIFTGKQSNHPDVIPPQAILASDKLNRKGTFDFIKAPDSYFLFNFSVDYKKGPFTTRVTVDNIFNQTYRVYTDRIRYFSDDIGRSFTIKAAYSF